MVRRTLAILIAVLTVDSCVAEIVYTNIRDTQVAGSWEFGEADAILVHPGEAALDLNHDGIVDVELTHHYIARQHRLSRENVDLLERAQLGQREILSILKDSRLLAISAAGEGVNDADKLSAYQARIDNGSDRIDRIAKWTSYDGNLLLDGSAGMTGISSHRDVNVLHVADTASEGNYTIFVDSAAERATFLTSAALANNLSQDETLTINGVTVDLFSDMTGTQVKDRVNQFTDQTGVTTHVNQNGADAGKLRLATTAFGAAAQLAAISNIAEATANSTSIGTVLIWDDGVDVVVEIAGKAFNGQGNTVTADSGPARGLSISLNEDTTFDGDNRHLTVAGDLGMVTIKDQSLSFLLDPSENESVSIALRTMHTSGLGLSVTGNQFNNLSEIEVNSASKAQDALAVIDSSIESVQSEIASITNLVDNYFLPFGEAFVEGLGLSEIALGEDGVEILSTGAIIGPESEFSRDLHSIGSLNFDGAETGFLGVRIQANDRYLYGWIRAELGENESLIVRDYAFESNADKTIRAGFVPEPSKPANVLIVGLLICRFVRRAMSNEPQLF